MRCTAMLRLRKNQQGVAAIEFALIITVLLTICFAIVSFGMLMWTQQKVSHIAGDSTRVALQHSISGDTEYAVKACEHAKAMVAADFILAGLLDPSDPGKDKVVCNAVPVQCVWDATQSCLRLTMIVTVEGLPLVNIVQAVGSIFSNKTDGWMPEKLSATSVVKITDLSGA
ncbi:MAG: pilus assembly protein [Alcaligenaceae bacterium]|nr:pilus assembly protein [Alcaligenaceae bacterium]